MFRMHFIFVYFVRGGFHTKIKCIRKNWGRSENPLRSATVRKFHAYERLEIPRIRKFNAYEIFWIYSISVAPGGVWIASGLLIGRCHRNHMHLANVKTKRWSRLSGSLAMKLNWLICEVCPLQPTWALDCVASISAAFCRSWGSSTSVAWLVILC